LEELSHDLEALASSGKKHSGFFFDAEKAKGNAFSPPHVNRFIEEQETKTKGLEPPQSSNKANGLEPKRDDGLTPMIFSALTEEYHQARSGLKAKTIIDNKAVYSVFIEFVGDVLSTDITHAMISDFRKKVQTLPSNFRKKYPNVSVKEFRNMNIPIDELMTPTTVNKYLSRISQVLKWAASEGHLVQNYASGKKILLSRKEKKRIRHFPFDHHDLDKIFMESPIHKENLRNGKKLEMFWVPLIALYSGMRLEEICQLQISDVREIEDEANDIGQMIWCFDVNENGHHKSVKNMPSERIVPIHSELIKMGLLDYFQERQSKGHQTLWNLEPAKSGAITRGYSHNFGKRLRAYIRDKAGIMEAGKTFHSFRHTVIQSLRNNRDVREDYLKALVGHELSGTTGTDYFSGLGVSLLKDTVEGIRYPKLDLSCLYTGD